MVARVWNGCVAYLPTPGHYTGDDGIAVDTAVNIQTFVAVIGQPAAWAEVDISGTGDWVSTIEQPTKGQTHLTSAHYLQTWAAAQASGITPQITQPDMPGDGSTRAQGATGTYNTHWQNYARNLAAAGLSNVILRLSAEFNYFVGNQGVDNATNFKGNWRQIVTAMQTARDVGNTLPPGWCFGPSGQPVKTNFRFMWCPARGGSDNHGNTALNKVGASELHVDNWYPGDDVVDIIGFDFYDQWAHFNPENVPSKYWFKIDGSGNPTGGTFDGDYWNGNGASQGFSGLGFTNGCLDEPYGLNWLAAFSTAHRKPIGFGEWGLWPNGSARSPTVANFFGADDHPDFIAKMVAWFAAHNVMFACYFQKWNDGATSEAPLGSGIPQQAVLSPDPLSANYPHPNPQSWARASGNDGLGTAAFAPYTQPLVITTGPHDYFVTATDYSAQMAAAGGTTHTWTATNLPPGMSMSPSGLLTGTVPLSGAGTYPINVTVSDNRGLVETVTFMTTWFVPYTPPAISSPASLPAASVGVAYGPGGTGVQIHEAGGTAAPFFWSADGLPASLTIDRATGIISGTPVTGDDAGSPYAVTVHVTDSDGPPTTVDKAYSLTVGVVALAIVADTLPPGTADQVYPNTQLHGSGGTPPYSWAAAGLPAGLAIDPTSGLITGTPTAATPPAGVDVIVTLTDSAGGGGSGPAAAVTALTASGAVPMGGGTITLTAHATDATSYTFWEGAGASPIGGLPVTVNSSTGTATTAALTFPANTTGFPVTYECVVQAVGPGGASTDVGIFITVPPTPQLMVFTTEFNSGEWWSRDAAQSTPDDDYWLYGDTTVFNKVGSAKGSTIKRQIFGSTWALSGAEANGPTGVPPGNYPQLTGVHVGIRHWPIGICFFDSGAGPQPFVTFAIVNVAADQSFTVQGWGYTYGVGGAPYTESSPGIAYGSPRVVGGVVYGHRVNFATNPWTIMERALTPGAAESTLPNLTGALEANFTFDPTSGTYYLVVTNQTDGVWILFSSPDFVNWAGVASGVSIGAHPIRNPYPHITPGTGTGLLVTFFDTVASHTMGVYV